jgi:hypothetical protein
VFDSTRFRAAAIFVLLTGVAGCTSSRPKEPIFNKPNDPVAIRKLMTPAPAPPSGEGTAIAIVLDTSGSMKEPVEGANLQPASKMEIARKALLRLVRQIRGFTEKDPAARILVGIYEFSYRKDQPPCREVFKLGAPDTAQIETAVTKLVPDGTTPIGDAMIMAARDLDASGMARRHMLVITDGENTIGYLPGDVARVIAEKSEAGRISIYFVAFDVAAEAFDPVKEAGGLVLAAEDETQLTDALDAVISGKIFVPPPAETAPGHPNIKR